MTTPNIKFDRRAVSLLGGMTEPALPDQDELREMVYKVAMLDEHDRDDHVLKGILRAYVALLWRAEEEKDEPGEVELVDDGHGSTMHYDAEKLWRQHVVAGYLYRLPACKDISEDDLYDRCTWYTFPSLSWPPKLLAEIAFARGVRDALEAQDMAKWVKRQETE
jgi:hypothetical protein